VTSVTRIVPERELARVIRLLEALREGEAPADLNVEIAVARCIRLLPLPRPWASIVTLRQFAWAAAAALAMVATGALGLLGVLGIAGASGPASSLAHSLSRTGSALLAFLLTLARTLLRVVVEAAGRLSGPASRLGGAIDVAGLVALAVCALMIVMTVLVVTHETRSRRFTA